MANGTSEQGWSDDRKKAVTYAGGGTITGGVIVALIAALQSPSSSEKMSEINYLREAHDKRIDALEASMQRKDTLEHMVDKLTLHIENNTDDISQLKQELRRDMQGIQSRLRHIETTTERTKVIAESIQRLSPRE